jgi:signal transduction histidine kinase
VETGASLTPELADEPEQHLLDCAPRRAYLSTYRKTRELAGEVGCETDTGVGIAPEDQAAVFEEFRQVGSSAAKQEGTGLGLALCRKFVELHSGTIWVTSAVGARSTFTFRLPERP